MAYPLIGSLRKHDVDGSENVIWKCNFSFPQSFLNYSKSSRLQNVLTIQELNWNQRFRDKKTKLNICHHVLTSSSQLQNRSFHVVERTRTSEECAKMKTARAKRAKLLFFVVKYANLWRSCFRCRRGCVNSLIGSLRSTTRPYRRRHKICILNWQKQTFSRPSRAFFNSVHFFQVLGKSATWNDHFSSFTENVNT